MLQHVRATKTFEEFCLNSNLPVCMSKITVSPLNIQRLAKNDRISPINFIYEGIQVSTTFQDKFSNEGPPHCCYVCKWHLVKLGAKMTQVKF